MQHGKLAFTLPAQGSLGLHELHLQDTDLGICTRANGQRIVICFPRHAHRQRRLSVAMALRELFIARPERLSQGPLRLQLGEMIFAWSLDRRVERANTENTHHHM